MTIVNTLTSKRQFKDSTDEEQSPSEQDDDSGDNYGSKSKANRRTTFRNKKSKPNKPSSTMVTNKPRIEKYSKKDGFIVDDESDEDGSDVSEPTKTRTSSRRRTGSSSSATISSRSKTTTRKSRSNTRIDDGEDDDLSGDDGQGLDTSVIINSGRRTRGKKVDYSQFNRQAMGDDDDLGIDNNDIEDDVISDSDSDSDGSGSGSSSISD